MSIVNPLTASSDIQRSLAPKTVLPDKEKPIKPDLGVFSADLVELSRLGIEKQKKEAQVNASSEIKTTANEVISVNSTIGRDRSVSNLTKNQATDLYNKISSML